MIEYKKFFYPNTFQNYKLNILPEQYDKICDYLLKQNEKFYITIDDNVPYYTIYGNKNALMTLENMIRDDRI